MNILPLEYDAICSMAILKKEPTENCIYYFFFFCTAKLDLYVHFFSCSTLTLKLKQQRQKCYDSFFSTHQRLVIVSLCGVRWLATQIPMHRIFVVSLRGHRWRSNNREIRRTHHYTQETGMTFECDVVYSVKHMVNSGISLEKIDNSKCWVLRRDDEKMVYLIVVEWIWVATPTNVGCKDVLSTMAMVCQHVQHAFEMSIGQNSPLALQMRAKIVLLVKEEE